MAYTCGAVDSTHGVHLIKDLHIALANKPLQIYFQPTVDKEINSIQEITILGFVIKKNISLRIKL